MTIANKTRRSYGMRRRRGAALIEFVVIVPLLATILGLTFFFGWAMKNQQRVKVASRYHTWRALYCGSYPKHPTEGRHLTLNEMLFDNTAGGVGTGGGQGPIESLEELVESTAEKGGGAQNLAQTLVMEHCPRGRAGSVEAGFPTDVGIWERYRGPIYHRHTREGKEWRRGQFSYLEPIKDLFLQELDDVILDIAHPQLRENLRRLYLKRW